MSKTIRTNGNVIVDTTLDGNANITLATNTVLVNGNLAVLGTVNTVNIENTNIVDRFITLNVGEQGVGVTMQHAGLYVDRGPSGLTANVGIRWDEAVDQWQYTNNGVTWVNFDDAFSGSGINNVVEDSSPQLGGDLDLNGFDIFGTTASTITLGTTTVSVDSVGAAGSGVYVTNGADTDEFVTKRRALAFAMIL